MREDVAAAKGEGVVAGGGKGGRREAFSQISGKCKASEEEVESKHPILKSIMIEKEAEKELITWPPEKHHRTWSVSKH